MNDASIRQLQEAASQAAAMLRAVGNEHRLLALCLLIEYGEMTVGELNEYLPLSQSALSQHLAVLREDGLVTTRREAQTIYYTVSPGPTQRVIQTLHDVYCGNGPASCK